jgi:Putative zincin peptidase
MMSLMLIDRFHPRRRLEQQAVIDAGQLCKLDELALLEPEQMRPLAILSLVMFAIGGVFFVLLNIAAYSARRHVTGGRIEGWGILIGIALNIVAYIVVLPLHEGIHGLAFAFWGGKPYFGTKLPFALYCGAKNQLFHRDQYLVVGLAPLVIITLAGIVFTLLYPGLAVYTLLGTVGNFSGAAGDVWSVTRILRQPAKALVEDTETGYRVWQVSV